MANQNTVTYAEKLQNMLDQQMVHGLKTGFMDANAGQVIYNGGKTVKIGTVSTTGLMDYKRGESVGFTTGKATFAYDTYTMTQDRGTKFILDSQDVDETNFQFTMAQIMKTFQEEHVIPEVDAYRLSKVATTAIGVTGSNNYEDGYTVASSTIIDKIKDGVKVIRENGYEGQVAIMCTYEVLTAVEKASLSKLSSTTFSQGGINTKVPSIDDCPLIPVPKERLVTAITTYDGTTTNQTSGGFVKGTSAKDVNFLLIPTGVP